MATGVFASNEVVKEVEKENVREKENIFACCTRRAVDEEGDELIRVRYCNNGDGVVDQVSACAQAEAWLTKIIDDLTP